MLAQGCSELAGVDLALDRVHAASLPVGAMVAGTLCGQKCSCGSAMAGRSAWCGHAGCKRVSATHSTPYARVAPDRF
eukprot:5081971-Amphidinium_carterae.1